MCDTSDAGVSPVCFRTTRRLKGVLTRGRVGLVGKTKYLKLVYHVDSTTLTTKKAMANIVPQFVIRRN